MAEGAGVLDWLLVAGLGLIVALFLAFFYLVIRLCLGLAGSGCAYNSAQSPDSGQECGTLSVAGPEKPLTDQGNRT